MKIEKTISIAATPAKVWAYLTQPELMEKWIGEPEMNIKVETDWVIGKPITIKGFHHIDFQNTGEILAFVPHQLIRYNHLSSLSKLPARLENHTTISFSLQSSENTTQITVVLENFPSETIYRHLDFYWQSTIHILRKQIEES